MDNNKGVVTDTLLSKLGVLLPESNICKFQYFLFECLSFTELSSGLQLRFRVWVHTVERVVHRGRRVQRAPFLSSKTSIQGISFSESIPTVSVLDLVSVRPSLMVT